MGQTLSVLAEKLYQNEFRSVLKRRDRGFIWLMAIQWLSATILALLYQPRSASGDVHANLPHAIFIGGALSLPPIILAIQRPGWVVTRHVMAIAQMLWSALFIHLTGGRIETHFHIFGSLAFLAFYRDWKVLATGTLVMAFEHLFRGMLWPESVYGVVHPEWWRFLEHTMWMLFEDVVLVMGVIEVQSEMRAQAARQAEMLLLHDSIEDKVIERTQEMEAGREQYRLLVETTQTVPWRLDSRSLVFRYIGPQGSVLLGCALEAWLEVGFWDQRLHPEDRADTIDYFSKRASERGGDREFRLRRDDDSYVWVRSIINFANDGEREMRGVFLDVTKERQLEFELQQAQKLESVGRLASGIAHEINTPVQFVNDSVHFVRDAFKDTLVVLAAYSKMREALKRGELDEAAALDAAHAEETADMPYIVDHVPKALDRCIDGLGRIATLVRSMKEFAHPDQNSKESADLNRALETTLTIAKTEYKYVADLITELGELPSLVCHIGELNQVFLNLVVNAAHAIGDVVRGTDGKGTIRVQTRLDGHDIVVTVSDTGGGIPEHVRSKIFEPFFTTKAVGKGTGQGLAIARSVVVEKHGGSLTFETTMGVGTTFIVRIPATAELSAKAA